MKCAALAAGVGMTLLMGACDRATTISDTGFSGRQPTADALVSQTNEQNVPWADAQQNPCTGDYVTIQGVSHFIFHVTADGSGGYHISSDVDSRGTGLGFPSGFTYQVKDWFTDSQQTNGAQFSWLDERDVQVLGPRSVDNYIMHFVFKLTVNALGVPTASFEKPTTRCVG